jgi:hypothetical protein
MEKIMTINTNINLHCTGTGDLNPAEFELWIGLIVVVRYSHTQPVGRCVSCNARLEKD